MSILLYSSETWTTISRHEKRLNVFNLRSPIRILVISWQNRVTSSEKLSSAGLPSIYTLLRQRRLRWLGQLRRIDGSRILKAVLYRELSNGSRAKCCPELSFKYVTKNDMKHIGNGWGGVQPWTIIWRREKRNFDTRGRKDSRKEKAPRSNSDICLNQRKLRKEIIVKD